MRYHPLRGDLPLNIIDKTPVATPAGAADTDRFRLRRFLDELPPDEIEVRSDPVDLAGIAEVLEGNPRAVVFRTAGPEHAELAANVTGSRSRIARAFGYKPNELTGEIQRRLRNRSEIVEIPRTQAPAQEV